MEAEAGAGGMIPVTWLYNRAKEYLGPGAGNFSAPDATVPMNHPTVAARCTWQSEPLTDGQEYRFTIRIATVRV